MITYLAVTPPNYRVCNPRRSVKIRNQRLDKSSGFVEEDNSGRSNIFSTGEKSLYNYSPTAEKVARQGLGGAQGLVIIFAITLLVFVATVSINKNEGSMTMSTIEWESVRGLTEIATRF